MSDIQSKRRTFACKFCGKVFQEFLSKAMRGRKFCSHHCYGESMKKWASANVACAWCGVEFHVRGSRLNGGRGKCCSKTCSVKSRLVKIEDRFHNHVSPRDDNGCMKWTGNVAVSGYGFIRADNRGRPLLAHRVAYEMAKGPIPDGMLIRHTCDTPSCVNPAHLVLGTDADNVRDMVARDRCTAARLLVAQVREIRSKYADGNITVKELASQYFVGESAIWKLLARKTWKHV